MIVGCLAARILRILILPRSKRVLRAILSLASWQIRVVRRVRDNVWEYVVEQYVKFRQLYFLSFDQV